MLLQNDAIYQLASTCMVARDSAIWNSGIAQLDHYGRVTGKNVSPWF